MDPIRDQIERMTRRHFFGQAGLGLGTAALTTLMAENGTQRDDSYRQPGPERVGHRRPARSAAFSPEGQASDLPVHERRPVANGLV